MKTARRRGPKRRHSGDNGTRKQKERTVKAPKVSMGSASSKLSYGMPDAARSGEAVEKLRDARDMDREAALTVAENARSAMHSPSVAKHFLPASQQRESVSDRVPGTTRKERRRVRTTKKRNDAIARRVLRRRGRDGKQDSPDRFEYADVRDATPTEALTYKGRPSEENKMHSQRFPSDCAGPTEAPAVENDSVRRHRADWAARRGPLEANGARALQGREEDGKGVASDGAEVPEVEPAALQSVETRTDLSVMDSADFDAQTRLAFAVPGTPGERLSDAQRSRLEAPPSMNTETPPPADSNAFQAEHGLPTISEQRRQAEHDASDETSPWQTPSAMISQLVLHTMPRVRRALGKVKRLWEDEDVGEGALTPKSSIYVPPPYRRASSLIGERIAETVGRDPAGRASRSDPAPRRKIPIAEVAMYALYMLNMNDAFFANDKNDVAQLRPGRPEPCDLAKIDHAGVVKRLVERACGELRGPNRHAQARPLGNTGRVGKDYFRANYERGTSRVHPRHSPEMPRLRREYIESYMRQPIAGNPLERTCRRGENCYCNTVASDHGWHFTPRDSTRFVCREFLLPDQERDAVTCGRLPEERRACILCYIKEVNRQYHQTQLLHLVPTRPYNEFMVEVDAPGQYANEHCLNEVMRRDANDVFTGVLGPFPVFRETDFCVGSMDIVAHNPNGTRVTHSVSCMRHHPSRVGF